jgi:CPA1 family monovalent cation:H+ antiporter
MFLFHRSIEELFLIFMTTYTSFTIAEVLGLSAILAMIIAVVFFKIAILKHIKNFEEQRELVEKITGESENKKRSWKFRLEEKRGKISLATTRIKLNYNEEVIESFSIIATAILFFALSELINLDLLLKYWKEILIMFVATTVIRAVMMLKFAYITNKTSKMQNVNMRWWGVLTFSGIKGGLSIVMVHNIPSNFQYKEMFETVVIGVVLLSIFVYSGILFSIIKKYSTDFEKEFQEELEVVY